MRSRPRIEAALPIAAALLLLAVLGDVWAARWAYPFDLEWMEGGMLAHAWRLAHDQPLYVSPNPDFTPFIYPPGYAAVVAALSTLVELSPPLGRAVSLVGTLVAAGALVFGVRRQHGPWPIALATAAVFLGTYSDSGAFFDLVRPDGLSVALLGWAVVIAAEDRRGAPIAAGLLLCAAFLAKHNAAVFGFPIALGLLVRGWRPALSFSAAAALPGLAAVALLQWRSGGAFLTYLLEVPSTHAMLWERARIDTVRELGTALPIPIAAIGLSLVWRGMTRQQRVPVWLAAVAPVWLGVGAAWLGTYFPPPAESRLLNVPSAFAYWALAAAPVALGLELLGGRPSWRLVYGVAVGATAVGSAMLMRAHDGGFVNVHIPLFWVVSLAFGVTATRLASAPALRRVVTLALVAQLGFAVSRVDRERLVPRSEDIAAGERFVALMREVDGPVLSPFGAWLPVYAGRPPSVHAMAIWDCNYAGGPYQDDIASISEALRRQRWVMILGGTHRFVGKLTDYYDEGEVVVEPDVDHFMPRTGWRSRPWRTLYPKESLD